MGYTENINSILKWGNSFQRQFDFPLDRSGLHSSYEDAVKYAKGDGSDSRGLGKQSYIGQNITVWGLNEKNEEGVWNYVLIPSTKEGYKADLKSVGEGGASGSIDTIAGTLNIRDINAVKEAQAKLGDDESATYIITDSYGDYPSPNNPTVYLDSEEIILDLLYRGNGDALKWLLINKQAYYKISGTWYFQTITNYVKLPALHLRTAQVGDFITLVRHDMPVSEFYSKYIDYNNLNLNLDTTSKTAFDTYLVGIGVKGVFESISDGEAIKRLVEGGYIYTAKDNPRKYPDTVMNSLVGSNNTVTFYTAQITPNTQHMYNGEFWTGNMTDVGVYSYVTTGRPDGSEEGEVYTAYVSPDKTQTLVSMKNPSKAYTRTWNNVESKWLDWNKINFASKNTKYGWGTKANEMFTTGICAYTPDTIKDINANWTVFVDCSSDPDGGGYYHLKQTAVCRDGENIGKMWTRLGWYKGEGEDLNFLDWQEIGSGNAFGNIFNLHFIIDVESGKLDVNEEGLKSQFGTCYLLKNLGEENEEWLNECLSLSDGDMFVAFATDYVYVVFKDEESGEWEVEKYPTYSERFATKEEVRDIINESITKVLNEDV